MSLEHTVSEFHIFLLAFLIFVLICFSINAVIWFVVRKSSDVSVCAMDLLGRRMAVY
jgi:hypothetical protein